MTTTGDDQDLHVLLVDQDEANDRFVREFSPKLPHGRVRLDWVRDLDQAAAAIARQAYDLFLIDERTVGANGRELIRLIDDRADVLAAPVFLLTGRGSGNGGDEDVDPSVVERGKLDEAFLDRAIRYSLRHKRLSERAGRTMRERVESALRDADRRQDEFLAVVAHELRNPLAPIRAAIEILRLAGDQQEVREPQRAMIDRQVQRLVRIIDDVLDLSRISRGLIQLRKERIALGPIVAGAVASVQPAAERLRHSLDVVLPDPDPTIEADPARLDQILVNLLNNACKYTEAGGKIRLQARDEGESVCIRIRDNGIGIPAEHLGNLFRAPGEAQSAPDRSHGGLGIGLSLAHHLVALHGGTIEVLSDGPGRGTEFVVRLPKIRDEKDPATAPQSRSTPGR